MEPQTGRSPSPRPPVARLAVSCAVLAIVIAPAATIIAWISNGDFSSGMLAGAAFGGGVCWLAAALALTTTFLGNRLHFPVQGMLVAMMFRMGLPLAAVVMLQSVENRPAGSVSTATIVGTYLIALIVETALSLRMIAPGAPAIEAATVARGS